MRGQLPHKIIFVAHEEKTCIGVSGVEPQQVVCGDARSFWRQPPQDTPLSALPSSQRSYCKTTRQRSTWRRWRLRSRSRGTCDGASPAASGACARTRARARRSRPCPSLLWGGAASLLLETKSAASQQRSPGEGASQARGGRRGAGVDLLWTAQKRPQSARPRIYSSCRRSRVVCAAPRRRRGMPYVSSSGVRFEMDGPSRQRRTTLLAYVVIASAVLLSLAALVRLGSAASAAVASVSGASAAATSHRAMPTRRVVTADDLVEASGGNSTIPT